VGLDFISFRSSGLAVYFEKLTKALSRKHEVTAVVSDRGLGKKFDWQTGNVRVTTIPFSRYDRTGWICHSLRATKLLRVMKRKGAFDLVHFGDIHFGFAYDRSFIATLHQSFNQRLGASAKLPYHSSLTNLITRYFYYNFAKIMEKMALMKANKLIAVSNATKEEFVTSYGIESAKIEVIHNGVDTNFFRKRNARKLRERLGIRGQKVLLCVGFMTPRKGVEYLAKALNNLDNDFILILLGKWESGYRKCFRKYLGLIENRVMEIGYVDDQEMPYYYSLADLYVHPSLLEGFGLPLTEAMACGTPVVATRVGAVPEVVGDCGVLVPPRNADILAKAVNTLLTDDSLRQELGKKARVRVERLFNEELMIEKYLEFYERIQRA